MSEADSLRMVAEVVDKFSSPLKNLRSALQSMSKDGAAHAQVVQAGFNKVEAAAKSAGQTTSTVLNPALAAVGVTGLSAVAALTGIGAAMRSFGNNTTAMAQLGRETGMTAENVRLLQSVMSKFGVEADASSGAIKTFSDNLRLAKDGVGPLMEFLRTQGRTTEGRKYFNDLADSIKSAKDPADALAKAMEGLEHVQDPAGRRTMAQSLFGNGDLGRLGDQHLGKLRDLMEKQRKILGPLDPKTVESAEQFDKAMSGLATTMQRLGTAIATEALPYVTEFAKGVQGLIEENREDITKNLREGVRELGTTLREIDWHAAKDGANDFLKGTAEGAKAVTASIREIAAVMRALNQGKYFEAMRRMDGSSGPLARKLAPMVGDDEIEAKERADQLRESLKAAESAKGSWLGQHGLASAGDPDQIRGELEKAEERLKALRGRNTDQRQADFDKAHPTDPNDAKRIEDQRRELGKNTEELKRLREALPDKKPGEATPQKSAFEGGDSPFGDAKIVTASFGSAAMGMARVGNALSEAHRRSSTVPAPRALDGEILPPMRRGMPDAPMPSNPYGLLERLMPQLRPFLRQMPDYGGRRYASRPDGEGDRGPGLMPRIQTRPGGPGERVRRWQRNEPEPGNGMPDPGANPGAYKDVLDHIADSEGTINRRKSSGYNTSYGNGKFLPGGKEQNLTGMTLDEISALGRHMRRQPGNPNSSALGRYQIVGDTMRGLMKKFGFKGTDLFDEKMQDRMAAELAKSRGADPRGLQQEWESLRGERGVKAAELMRKVPRSASTIPNDRPKAAQPETADGEGFASRQRAMKAFTDENGLDGVASNYRRMQGKMDALNADINSGGVEDPVTRALRSGALGSTPKLDANGSVHIRVDKAGPNAQVSTSTAGDLFREVRVSRGRTMAPASQGD